MLFREKEKIIPVLIEANDLFVSSNAILENVFKKSIEAEKSVNTGVFNNM